jgi:hypothetical protein
VSSKRAIGAVIVTRLLLMARIHLRIATTYPTWEPLTLPLVATATSMAVGGEVR